MLSRTFAPGQLIADRFSVVRLISRGGMGEVYEVDDLELDETVALKVVSLDNTLDSERSRQNIRREVQLARKVTHPNVCRTFDVFRHQDDTLDLVVVTMELLRGETLSSSLRQHGSMTPTEALPLIVQMARALQAAHHAGVIHRDLKSNNVMLVPDGNELRAVVTDFGIALPPKTQASHTNDNEFIEICGTPEYMSPEQGMGQTLGPASDIYSFGIVIYEMLTGEIPHRATTPLAVIATRLEAEPPAPRKIVANLDPKWNDAVLRCLQLDAADRFQNVSELLSALFKTDVGRQFEKAPGIFSSRKMQLIGIGTAALMLILVGALAFLGFNTPKITPLPSPIQLTTTTGLEVDPVFSPDGKSIAYTADQTGKFEIYLRNLDSGEESRLTDEGLQNFQPSWSPDGTKIVYYSENAGGIWIVPSAGGTPEQLIDFGSNPKWSPNGTEIVLQSGSKVQLAANSVDALPPSTIWRLQPGGEAVQLTQPGHPPGGHGAPTWSPDGQHIAFSSSYRRESKIWSISTAGDELSQIVDSPDISFNPSYNNEGDQLYFTAVSEGERYGVWKIPLQKSSGLPNGDAQNILNLGSVNIRQFAVSKDGSSMVFSGLATISNLWSLAIDVETGKPSGEPQALTSGTGRNNRPTFSPNGLTLAFDRWNIGVNQNIWLMNADGSSLRQLTKEDHSSTQANFIAEGKNISFMSDRSESWALWSVPIEGGATKLLGDLPPNVGWARLSPDGYRVAFHSNEGGSTLNIWTALADGSDAEQLTFDDEMAGYPCWSPDGSQLAIEVKRGDDVQLAVMPSLGGTPRLLTKGPGRNWPYGWSPDGDKISFAGYRDDLWNLWWISTSTGEVVQLTDTRQMNAYVRYPAWSPTGDRIVYEFAQTAGDIWIVENLR